MARMRLISAVVTATMLLFTSLQTGTPSSPLTPTVFVGMPTEIDAYTEGGATPLMRMFGPGVAAWGIAATPARIYSVSRGAYHRGSPPSVAVLQPSHGRVMPIAVIRCGLIDAWAAAVDAFGNVHVTDPRAGSVVTFASTANGCADPISVLHGPNTLLGAATGIAINRLGRIITSSGPANSLSVYRSGAAGDSRPLATIAGPKTALSEPEGVAVDAFDSMYAANYNSASVTEYPSYATGDAVPSRTIAGSNTQLRSPIGIAISRRTGEIYVADFSAFGSGAVLVFAPAARGNVAPIRVLRAAGATSVTTI
ncbi:MAG: hypothetical protein NVSMB64_28110 [Candidatus Velthaea sp.]